MVANAYLIHSLDIITLVAEILGKTEDAARFKSEAAGARIAFAAEYVSPNGRLVSDTQTAYAVSICFDLLRPHQVVHAGNRLAAISRRNQFRVGTGFAGTPFICEALVKTGHSDIAYAILLTESCPSWLYPVTMGASTMWERWDSMLPDGSINPGEMTSFNHYAYGAIAKFMVQRLAGLQQLEPGWKRTRVQPEMGGELTWATAKHLTPYGLVSSSWVLKQEKDRLLASEPLINFASSQRGVRLRPCQHCLYLSDKSNYYRLSSHRAAWCLVTLGTCGEQLDIRRDHKESAASGSLLSGKIPVEQKQNVRVGLF
ncbi:bacterial alpha-L-rhamnosidase domain-containing protein [Ilyonectria robusta]